ncbi:hypothetical protein D1007_24793 [Hordeum vulgare]|nr:hypothetical protein D1007_24793 [Hordeum vulgare]
MAMKKVSWLRRRQQGQPLGRKRGSRGRGEAVLRVADLWVCSPYASGFRSGQQTVKQETRGGATGQKVNKVPIDGTQRNRASPQAICKLYKHINEDQHAAIREMGTGPFLDIKCGYLHNTIVTWFTRLYQRGRRGFVVHRRGFIPLTEESVHKILGIPRGDIDVKYEADYDNEDEIVSCLFPGDSSRPKITTVASKIMNNNNADATFKKLWLIYIVSTVLAPTTDTRISNKCYPILLHEHLSKGKYTKGCLLYCMLRYLDALDCDGMELELPDTPHTVNAWSKTQIDVVAEMDMLEHDPPSFGNFQKKLKATTIISKFASGVGTLLTEFESGVDKLLIELVQGLTAPTTSNSSNSRINSGADTREREDTLSKDSSSSESHDGIDEDDADIECEKKKRNTSDVCSSENNSPTDTLVNNQELEQKIRGSAVGLANRLCELKSRRPADTERDSGITHEEIKLIVAKELGLLKETCTEHFEERNAHKDLTKINARPIKQMTRR